MTDIEKLIAQCDEQIEKLIDVQKQMDTAWEYYTPDLDYDFLISVVAAYRLGLMRERMDNIETEVRESVMKITDKP